MDHLIDNDASKYFSSRRSSPLAEAAKSIRIRIQIDIYFYSAPGMTA